MQNKKRILISTLCGAALGVICILGASQRAGGWAGNGWMLFGLWFNRLMMGLVIGSLILPKNNTRYFWAAGWGLILGLSWYLASGMHDLAAFLVSIVYGLIIEWVAGRFE